MRWKERSSSCHLSSHLHTSTAAHVFALPTKEHVKKYVKFSEKGQQGGWSVIILATKPYDLSLIIQTDTMEEEQTLTSCPQFSTCVSYHIYMYT